jgi:hypothetical protein
MLEIKKVRITMWRKASTAETPTSGFKNVRGIKVEKHATLLSWKTVLLGGINIRSGLVIWDTNYYLYYLSDLRVGS